MLYWKLMDGGTTLYQHPLVPKISQIKTAHSCGKRGRPRGAKDKVSRFTRSYQEDVDVWEPTARDIAIVEAVYCFRRMTTEQIATLLFPNTSIAQCRLRLRKLTEKHYLYRIAKLNQP